jgi:CRISPR-associated protein Csd1
MILQALKEYYERKAADAESGIAPDGWEHKEIPFVVVLDENGKLVQIEDTREADGKKKRGRIFLVPQGVKRTVGIAANLLWDTGAYIFGVMDTAGMSEDDKRKKSARLPEQRKAFIERVKSELPDTPRKTALLSFLNSVDLPSLEKEAAWADIFHTNPNVSFRFSDDIYLYCQSEEIKAALAGGNTDENETGRCLVSGDQDSISVLHTAIKGVWGGQPTGANIVSFNKDSFESYGKKKRQGLNAPVGAKAMFAYTTALNTLLASKQRMQVGDASTVFWAEKQTRFEDDFSFFFSEPPKDDPDANTRAVKALFESPSTGAYVESYEDTKFYVLGLSPNAARISVRFWKTGTVSEFAGNIRQHFEDTAIIKPQGEPEYYSLWRLLVNAAVQDKTENIPPNIAGDFMRAILDGTPYPATLLQLVLRRVKSDTEYRVKPVRAALIKACLNRLARFQNTKEKELTMGLDIEQPSTGYQLGRLFAVLEKIQEEANPGLNATIRERYYGAACGSPVTVFPTLLRLKNHHIAKLENKGRVINLETLLGEIVSKIDDFPAHLSLHEQGKFAIGYYHQRQDFFTKKDKAVSKETALFNESEGANNG